MITLNLLALILTAVAVASFCRNWWLKATVSTLFGVFLCMQLASLYVGGAFCDYKFFAHFNLRDFWWGATSFYKVETIVLPLIRYG